MKNYYLGIELFLGTDYSVCERSILFRNEFWKEIENCDYRYGISSLGRIKYITSFHKRHIGKVNCGRIDRDGYMRTSFTKNGRLVGKFIHHIVAQYFVKNYDASLTINHIDSNKKNNYYLNLESMTRIDNVMDFIKKRKKLTTSSRYIGVSFHKNLNKWTARINKGGKRISVGTFLTEKEAVDACEKYYLNPSDSMLKIGQGKYKRSKRGAYKRH